MFVKWLKVSSVGAGAQGFCFRIERCQVRRTSARAPTWQPERPLHGWAQVFANPGSLPCVFLSGALDLMNLWQDIRYGERMLRKSPGFAITAVVTLALGIGATTAVFSVCDSLLWKPIALPHLESLAVVVQGVPGAPNDWNSSPPADLDDVRRQSTALENFTTWDRGMANIVGNGGQPERAMQALVNANFF